MQGSTLVILLNFCAKNPPHRQGVNREIYPLSISRPHFRLSH
jgi:hypothetical protein